MHWIRRRINDLELNDDRAGRPETAGLGAILCGVALRCGSEADRIALASDALGALRAGQREETR